MNIGIAYSDTTGQVWLKIDVPDDSTVLDAIERSGVLQRFDIDLETQKVGIFGKVTKLENALKEGDRVEIYRPITADPETIERRD